LYIKKSLRIEKFLSFRFCVAANQLRTQPRLGSSKRFYGVSEDGLGRAVDDDGFDGAVESLDDEFVNAMYVNVMDAQSGNEMLTNSRYDFFIYSFPVFFFFFSVVLQI